MGFVLDPFIEKDPNSLEASKKYVPEGGQVGEGAKVVGDEGLGPNRGNRDRTIVHVRAFGKDG